MLVDTTLELNRVISISEPMSPTRELVVQQNQVQKRPRSETMNPMRIHVTEDILVKSTVNKAKSAANI